MALMDPANWANSGTSWRPDGHPGVEVARGDPAGGFDGGHHGPGEPPGQGGGHQGGGHDGDQADGPK